MLRLPGSLTSTSEPVGRSDAVDTIIQSERRQYHAVHYNNWRFMDDSDASPYRAGRTSTFAVWVTQRMPL